MRIAMKYCENLDLEDIVYFCEISKTFKTERWKDIPDYEKSYKVSDLGRVKSLKRPSSNFCNKDKILVLITIIGYKRINLLKNGKRKGFMVHRLVMLAFNQLSNLTVDHINSIRDDNRLCNLRYCTQRENVAFYIAKNYESIGVHFYKNCKKWGAKIIIKNAKYNLGFYTNKDDAINAYNTALYNWENKQEIPVYINPSKTSKYKNISFIEKFQKWQITIRFNRKNYNFGHYTEEDVAFNILTDIQTFIKAHNTLPTKEELKTIKKERR